MNVENLAGMLDDNGEALPRLKGMYVESVEALRP